jgi:hypothetical protein
MRPPIRGPGGRKKIFMLPKPERGGALVLLTVVDLYRARFFARNIPHKEPLANRAKRPQLKL